MKFIIDRFEGEFVVVELENKEMVDLPRIILPADAKEGDMIKISIDETETERRKRIMQERFNNLLSE